MVHCPKCGNAVDANDIYCKQCGQSLKSNVATNASSSPEGHWEYQTFSVPLGNVKVKGTYSFKSDGGVPDNDHNEMTAIIEAAVEEYLQKISKDGWEPMESTNADDLWRSNHVENQEKLNSWTGKTTRTLISARVKFRRWVRS